MIAKAVKGKGFRGALEYDLTKEGGQVLDTNMAGEKLTEEQWREIGKRYMDGMGLEKNQFVITRHNDTEHEHIHILVNRIRFDGSVTSDSQDYKRQEAIMRELEQDYGLQRVAPSIEAERKAPTKDEIEGGSAPASHRQSSNCSSFTEYQERLEAVGVELVPVAHLEGAKLSGLSYRLDGVTMKGSDLGKAYSPAGLTKRGVTYEQDRDFAAVRASNERDTARAFGGPDRDSTADQAPERGGLGRDAGAVGAGAGRVDGRDTPDAGRDRPKEPGAGRDVQTPAIGISEGLQGGRSGSAESRREPEPSRGADGVEALRPSPVDRVGYGGARERVLALAGEHGLVLVDDLTADKLSSMAKDRFIELLQGHPIRCISTHVQKHRLESAMNTVRWNIAVSPDVDQSVRMFIAAQGGGRKGDLSRFIEEAVRAYLLERAVDQAKTAAAGMSDADLTDLIDEAVQWAREH